MGMGRLSRHDSALPPVASLSVTGALVAASLLGSYLFRKYRARWSRVEEEQYGHELLHSIIKHFSDMVLNKTSTVQDANQRRTVSYYLKAREAHLQSLVLGVGRYDKLLELRETELETCLQYYNKGDQSHRTVIVMCDEMTRGILHEARNNILQPLDYSHDPLTKGVWIPELLLIPPEDMHITVSIPWWWHTIREGNAELSRALANRFRQTLVLDFHHPFQIELERIVLLGGKMLVALWRTVGERTTEDGMVIYDRHGVTIDPMVRLRWEIVDCFTTENEEIGRKPLTYTHKQTSREEPILDSTTSTDMANDAKNAKMHRKSHSMPVLETPMPEKPPKRRQPMTKKDRQNTIEMKTPGMGQGDGFIHTTLARLPLACLSSKDVELEPVHRLCREATATYCGHRMIVSKFRFVETIGVGGESNPCVQPIFDETMDAPARVMHSGFGHFTATTDNLHLPQVDQERNATIGAMPDHLPTRPSVMGLFASQDSTNSNSSSGNERPSSVVDVPDAMPFGMTEQSAKIPRDEVDAVLDF